MNDVASPVLAQAARLALHAPSVFNTQPWRWRAGSDSLELYADPDRRLGPVDLDDRPLIMSCGAALHHARAAIAAAGRRAEVVRTAVPMPRTTDLPTAPRRPAGAVIEFETG